MYVITIEPLVNFYRSKNGFKSNIMQNRRHSLVQGLLQRSHWDRAPMLTPWSAHQLVAGHPWDVTESQLGRNAEKVEGSIT